MVTLGDIFGILVCWFVIDLIVAISKQRREDKASQRAPRDL